MSRRIQPNRVIVFIYLFFAACFIGGGGAISNLQAQGVAQVNITGIPTVLDTPFPDRIEDNFRSGRYQVIFNYTGSNAKQAFRFSFQLLQNGDELVRIDSDPKTFSPGTYVFTSFFEDVPFNQSESDIINQLDAALKKQVVQEGTIPEGNYTIRIQAIPEDNMAGVANPPALAQFQVQYPQPPILLSPSDDSNVALDTPVFSWTPVVTSTGTSFIYHFLLVELFDTQTPEQAVNANRALAQVDLQGQNTLPYTSQFLPLEKGHHYAWQVTAEDANGQMPLKEEGKSEINTFVYKQKDAISLGKEALESIVLQPNFAELLEMQDIDITEQGGRLMLNGRAVMQLDFNEPYRLSVEVQNLVIQQNSGQNPVVLGGTVLARRGAAKLPFLSEASHIVNFDKVRWKYGEGVQATGSIQLPDSVDAFSQPGPAKTWLQLTQNGLSGKLVASDSDGLATLGKDPVQLKVTRLEAAFPSMQLYASGRADVFGDDFSCEVPYIGLGDNFIARVDCSIDEDASLVAGSDRLRLHAKDLTGRIGASWSSDQLNYALEMNAGWKLKLASGDECGASGTVQLSSESGVTTKGVTQNCTDPEPTLNLGFMHLTFKNLNLAKFDYDTDQQALDFDFSFDAELFFPGAPNAKLPLVRNIHLTPEGIDFPRIQFGDNDLAGMGDINLDQVRMKLVQFAMDRFQFPWFQWDKSGPGPWDFEFDAQLQVPDNPSLLQCLRGQPLSIRGAHVDRDENGDHVITGGIQTEDIGACSIALGNTQTTIQIDKLDGRLLIHYNEDQLSAASRLAIQGSLKLGDPFDCNGDDGIPLASSDLVISGSGIEGTVEQIVPECPLQFGPYTAQVTTSTLTFSHDRQGNQHAYLQGEADLDVSTGQTAHGSFKLDLMDGTFDEASFDIQGPFQWGIPKDDPVLVFRIDEAHLNEQGFLVDGRQKLLVGDDEIGATFDQLVLDWKNFEVQSGSIILDGNFGFEAGIDSVSQQIDYSVARRDTNLTLSPGVLLQLAGTVTIDTLGLHTAGTSRAILDYGDLDLDSLEVTYSNDFAMGLDPFGIRRGRADLYWNQQRVAYADPSGFHPDMLFFAEKFLPDRIPLPTEQIAYIQIKENDTLLVNTTRMNDGSVRVETKPNASLKLVMPVLQASNPAPPRLGITLNNVRIDPSTGNYMGGTITADVPPDDPRFDLSPYGIPLTLRQVVYTTRQIANNDTDALFFDGNITLFDKDLGSSGHASLYMQSNGHLKGRVNLQNINQDIRLDPQNDRLVLALDSLDGQVTDIPMLSPGQSQFNFDIKGGFQFNKPNGDRAARADLDLTLSDQGLSVNSFSARALDDTARIELGDHFGFDINNVNSLSLGYNEQQGFTYTAGLDFAIRVKLSNGRTITIPLKDLEVRDQVGFVIPRQDINGASSPSIDNVPTFDMGIFRLKTLAFRMPKDTVNLNTWADDVLHMAPRFDFELTIPSYSTKAPDLAQRSITLQNIGLSDGVLVGSIIPQNLQDNPIFLPLGAEAGINIDNISGQLSKTDQGEQDFDIDLSGFFDMPKYFSADGQTCTQNRVDVSLSRDGGVRGTVQNFLPCGSLTMGPLSLAFGQSELQLAFANNTQHATIDGTANAEIQRKNASAITASGNLSFDLLSGKVLDGRVGINEPFDWYYPSDDSLFGLHVQTAEIDTTGLKFTGGGQMAVGDGDISVNFNNIAFSLTDGSITYGSMEMLNQFALDVAFNPTRWTVKSPADTMTADPGLRFTLPANLTLDKNGLTVDGESGAKLRYAGDYYADLSLDFVNMVIGFGPVGVTSGRADLMADATGETPTRLGWYDTDGFHADNVAGGVAMPDTLGLPTKDVAYIVLKDQNGNNLVQSSSVEDGLSLSTSQPVPLVLPSLKDGNGNVPQVDVDFSDIVINGGYEVISGDLTVDVSQTPLNLVEYGGYPFGLTALHFEKGQNSPYKMYADLDMDLPDALTDLILKLQHIALGPDGFEQTTVELGKYTAQHTEGDEPVLASHSFHNKDLNLAVRGVELQFAENNAYRMSGDISSGFIKNANGDTAVVHYAAEYSNGSWQFNLDSSHLTPQELPIGKAKLVLDDLQSDVTSQEFAIILDGRFVMPGTMGDDMEIGLEGLRIGTDGVSVAQVNTSGLTPQKLSLFGETDNMTISQLDLSLNSDGDLMLVMGGSLDFMDRNFSFSDLQLGSDGTFALGSANANLVDPQNPVQLLDQYFVLTQLQLGVQNGKAALTAQGEATLPAPFSSTSTLSLTVDNSGQVTTSGPQFDFNNASVSLGDLGSLELTGAGLQINDIGAPDFNLYASANLTIDGKTIEFGQAGSPGDWGVRYQYGSASGLQWRGPTNTPRFTFDTEFFALTIKSIKLADNSGQTFGVSLNTNAKLKLDGIGGAGLDLDGFQIDGSGIKTMGSVSGGSFNFGGVGKIEVGSFEWKKDETVDITRQDGSHSEPGSKTESVHVDEYLRFSNSGNGDAISITVPGGFSGGVHEIMYYTTSNSLYLNIDGVNLELSDYARLTASLEYLKQPNGFKLKVAGSGKIKATNSTEYSVAAMGRMSNINDVFSFGIFVSVEAEIPLVPSVISIAEVGGGFFYHASNQDFEDVVNLVDYDLYNDEAPWADKSGDYDFAIALNAKVNIIGTGGEYAVEGRTLILLTDQWYAMDVQGTMLDQGNKIKAGMYLDVAWDPSVDISGGAGVMVDYPHILDGEVSVDFIVKENSSHEIIWAVNGNGHLNIIGGIQAKAEFMVNKDGFYTGVEVDKGFDVWVISIHSNWKGSLWWVYNEQFGAYVQIKFNASLFGGVASVGGTLKGALIVDDGYLVYAAASAHVDVFMVFHGRVGIWVSLRNGHFDGGKGSNGAYEDMIADAKEQAQNMQDKMNDALNAVKDLQTPPDIQEMSDEALSAAGGKILSSADWYQNLVYNQVINAEQDIATPIPSVYQDIKQTVVDTDVPSKASYNLSTLRSDMEQKIDQLTTVATGAEERLRNTRAAAIQWEAQAESMAEAAINSPIVSKNMDWQGDQPPSVEIDQDQATANQNGLKDLKKSFEAQDKKFRAALDSIQTNISRINSALSMHLSAGNFQYDPFTQTYRQTGEMEYQPSANMVSEQYAKTTEAIDKYFGNYVSYLWSKYYWAKSNRQALDQMSTYGASSLRQAVIDASEKQLHDVNINVTYHSTDNVDVSMSLGALASAINHLGDIRDAASQRYYTLLYNNPNKSPSQASSERNDFESDMADYISNQDYTSFFGNYVQKGIEFWYKMPKLGYESIRDNSRTQAETVAQDYHDKMGQMQTAHETFTQLVDDIYGIKASMMSTLHGLMDTYIAFRSDTTTDAKVLDLKQQRADLEEKMAAPQISGIYVNKDLSGYSNKITLSWNATHPTGDIVENSYYLNEGTNASVYTQGMISSGGDEEVTRYVFKDKAGEDSKDYRVVIRVRGPSGITISRPGQFSASVHEPAISLTTWGSFFGSSQESIATSDDSPPTTPWVSPELDKSGYPSQSYWTPATNQLKFVASSFDAESDIAGFQYALGTTKGGSDVVDWTTGFGKSNPNVQLFGPNSAGGDNISREITIPNLDLQPGQAYYLSVRSVNGDSLVSNTREKSTPIRYDNTTPTAPTRMITARPAVMMVGMAGYSITPASPVEEAPMMDPPPNMSRQEPELDVNWGAASDPQSGIREYEYVLSSSPDTSAAFGPNADIKTTQGTNVTITGDPLTYSDTVYVFVRAVDHADRRSKALRYGPIVPKDPTGPSYPKARATTKTDGIGFYLVQPALDFETDIETYQIGVGDAPSSRNLMSWSDLELPGWAQFAVYAYKAAAENHSTWYDTPAQYVGIPTDNLPEGQDLYLQVRALNGQDKSSSVSYTGPVTLDTSPPQNPSVSLNAGNNGLNISVSNIKDPESGVSKVEYKITYKANKTSYTQTLVGWTDFISIYGSPTYSLNGSRTYDYGNRTLTGLKVYIRITNGNGRQTVVSQSPTFTVKYNGGYNYPIFNY